MIDGRTHDRYLQMPVFIQIDIEAIITTISSGENSKWKLRIHVGET